MRVLLATLTILLVISSVTVGNEIPAPKVLIITGDHETNWKETTRALKEILVKAGHKVNVTEKARLDLTPEKLNAYDVLLLNYKETEKGGKANPDSIWTDANKRAFAQAIKSGTGLVVAHGAFSAFAGESSWTREFEQLCAGGWQKRSGRKMHDLKLTVQRDHPITRGLTSLPHGRDELFQNLRLAEGSQVLVTAFDGREMDEPVVWVSSYGKGRVVQSALGRDIAAMQRNGFRTLIVRCVEWAGEKGFRMIFDGKTLKRMGRQQPVLARPQWSHRRRQPDTSDAIPQFPVLGRRVRRLRVAT